MAQVLESQRGPVTGTAVGKKKRRPFLLDLYSTAVGKKYVMAITGIGLIGFVVVPHDRKPEDVFRSVRSRPLRRVPEGIAVPHRSKGCGVVAIARRTPHYGGVTYPRCVLTDAVESQGAPSEVPK